MVSSAISHYQIIEKLGAGSMGTLQCDTAWRCATSKPAFGSRSPKINFRALEETTKWLFYR